LPTAAEGGLASMQFGIWHGLYAPAGTDAAIVDRLSQSLKVALKDPNVIERFAALATSPEPEENATPDALKAKVESEIARWKPLIEAAGVTPTDHLLRQSRRRDVPVASAISSERRDDDLQQK